MKKLVILICAATGIFVACNKEVIVPNEGTNSNTLYEYNSVILPKLPINLITYLNNSNENNDQKGYNISIYYLSKAITEVCRRQDLLNIIFSNFNQNSLIKLEDLMVIPEISVVVNEYLTIENQNYDELINKMKIDNVDYYPTIEFSNQSSGFMSTSEVPIVATGIPYEYYTNIDTLGGFVAAWQITENELISVLINENKKDNITAPVFIVNGATDYIVEVEIGNSNLIKKQKVEESPIIQAQWRTQYSGFKIDYRYESDKYSNYRFTGVIHTVNGPHSPDEKGGLICNVHKRDIGKSIVPRWGSLQLNNTINSEMDIYIESYYVTYEYDWYSTLKTVKMQNTQIGTINFKCRMNKPDEFYQIVRSVRNTHQTHYGKGFINVYNPCCF